jgi:hypothetical protein
MKSSLICRPLQLQPSGAASGPPGPRIPGISAPALQHLRWVSRQYRHQTRAAVGQGSCARLRSSEHLMGRIKRPCNLLCTYEILLVLEHSADPTVSKARPVPHDRKPSECVTRLGPLPSYVRSVIWLRSRSSALRLDFRDALSAVHLIYIYGHPARRARTAVLARVPVAGQDLTRRHTRKTKSCMSFWSTRPQFGELTGIAP